jgi:pimeloyl-ACP methyl ester carboxylesterase
MFQQINHDRRLFLGAAAMTLAAAQFGMSDVARPPAARPNKSFGPLKQIDAGVLNIGQYDTLERQLAQFPLITVPTITLEGDANGAPHPDPSAYAKKFFGKYSHRLIKGGIGHNLPQEAPQGFAEAVVAVDGY